MGFCFSHLLGTIDNSTMLAENHRFSAVRCSHTTNVCCAAILKNQRFSAQPSELSTAP